MHPAFASPDRLTRRRGETLEHAIYAAVLEQLADTGFSGLTMEGVATRAHTGKAALYRRWDSVEELTLAALDHLLPLFAGPPDTGNVRGDMHAVLHNMITMINSPSGCAIMALMSELGKEHDFVEAVHRHVLAPRETATLKILQRAAARGEIPPSSATQLIADVGPGMVLNRLLTRGAPIPPSFADEVVDQIVAPLLGLPPAPSTTRTTRARAR
jgi:AcrR family transcriptional regulator